MFNCASTSSCGTVDYYLQSAVVATPTPGAVVPPPPILIAPPASPSVPTTGGSGGQSQQPGAGIQPPAGQQPAGQQPSTPQTSPPPSAPTTQPPTVPAQQPPITRVMNRIGDGLDTLSRTIFGSSLGSVDVCSGPLGFAACAASAMPLLALSLSLFALLMQSELAAAVFSLMQIIGLRKRAKVWGVIYDSSTKRPVPLVKIELFDMAGRLLETRYADRDGRYGFLTSPASLHEEELRVRIRVQKGGYTFPAATRSVGTDYVVYDNLYYGDEIVLRHTATITHNIPMDPVAVGGHISLRDFGSGLIGTLGDRLLSFAFYVGLVTVPLNWWFAPTTKNIVIGIVFFVANGVRMLAMYRPYGITRDALTGKVMPFALVTLNDFEGNRQGFSVSDEHGRFILSGEKDKDYELISYSPANVTPQRITRQRVKGIRRIATRAWITDSIRI